MRDDRKKWDPPAQFSAGISAAQVTVRPVRIGRQTLLSGPRIATDALGWPDVATGEAYRLCLRRDRVLEIGGETRQVGWDAADKVAVSDMSFAYEVIEITGEKSFDLIQAGTEISRRRRSPSVARQFAGHLVLLYPWQDNATFRLHVNAAEAAALWLFLERAVTGL